MVRSGRGVSGALSDVLRLELGGSRGQGALSGCPLRARASGAAYGRDLPSESSQVRGSLP